MSVTLVHRTGMAYSKHTEAAYIDMAAFNSSQPYTPAREMKTPSPYTDNKHIPWACWGDDNLLPQVMTKDIETCGILNGITEGKARFSVCEGPIPAICERNEKAQLVIKSVLNGTPVNEWMDMNDTFTNTYALMKDFAGFNAGLVRFILTHDRSKIATWQRDDITEMRLAKMNDKGKITTAYLSAQWDRVHTNPKDDRIVSVPLLDLNNPLHDLKSRETGHEFAMLIRNPGWGKKYYPIPMWMTAYKWVKIAQGVPEMKAAMFENNMRIKYQVIIYEEYWSHAFGAKWEDYSDEQKEEERNKLFDSIDNFLVGAKNSFKSIFIDGKHTLEGLGVQYIEIKAIEDNTKQGELLPDSAAANSEIAFSLLFNPAIIGATMPSGPYTNSQGGSSVREAVLMQIIIHEFERQLIRRMMNVVKFYNGWDKEYPGLEFIIPATVLTTLDTGAGSKPVITGANASPSNNTTNAADN